MSTRDSLHVRSVRVDRLYGIDMRGVACDDLSPAVNVIYGPNAQGKTSLGLAIHGLIWPSELQNLRPGVEGRFAIGDDEFLVEIDGAGARYQRNGRDSPGPTVPESTYRSRYWLPLHKLLQADDKEFAEIIRRAALGGMDLERAASALGFEQPSNRQRATTRRVHQAEAKVREITEQQRKVHEEEEGLAALRHDLNLAIEAEQQGAILELAIAHAEARREEQASRQLLEQMPEAIANAREDDGAQLRQLRMEIDEATNRRGVSERRLKELKRRREANIVVLSGTPPSPVPKLEEQNSVLANLESGLVENRRAAAAAGAVERDAWQRIEGAVDRERAEQINVAKIAAIDEFIDEVETVRAEEKSLDALYRVFGDEEAADLERRLRVHDELIASLRAWLRAEQDVGRGSRRARGVAIAAALLLVIAAAVMGYLGYVIAAGATAGAGILVFIIWALIPRAESETKPPADLFERREIDPPGQWTTAEAGRRLEALEEDAADLRLRLRAAQRRDALQPQAAEAESRRQSLDESRVAIGAELGLEPPLRETQLRLFLESVSTWQKARADRLTAEAHLTEAGRLIEDIRADINATIAPFGVEAVGTAAEAKAVIDEINEAYRELAELEREIEREKLSLDSATSAEATAQKRVEAIFARLKLDPEVGDDVVVQLSEQLESYRDRYQEFAVKQQRLHEARRRLEGRGGIEFAESPEDELRRLHAHAETTASGKDRLLQQIAAVDTRIGDLRRKHDLEAAMADYEAALDALEKDFEEAADAAVGNALANHLIDRARDDQLPAVFVRARDLFHRISHGSYRLELDRRNGSFYAVDTIRDRGFELDQLSSGTRVQLLLAVRMAFVEEQELGSRLPIVLDEALAISDDDRAQAIVQTILTLAREGRQIFYFTAQHDEVAKWKRALEGIDHRLIPLGSAAGPEEVDSTAVPGTRFTHNIPSPNGHDRYSYGTTLGVPRWHAHMPVAELHLWYLVEDVGTLNALLERGFQYWGQLAALGRDGALDATGTDEATYSNFAVKAAALEAWQRCWGVGRGRRLDREALSECPAVSAVFLDRVADLCKSLEGDGARLLERIREGAVPRFQAKNVDELEQYLVDEGFIDRDERLSDDEIQQRVSSQIAADIEQCGLTLADIDRFFEDVRNGAPSTEE